MVTIEVLSRDAVAAWVDELHATRHGMALGILFAGDRWSCIDEVVTAKVEDEIVGIATIAPEGEQMSGQPTIVALYVFSEHRRGGVGCQLLEAAIDRMLQRGLEPIRIDALHSGVLRMIDRLPIEKRQKIRVVDQSIGGFFDAMMEREL